MSDFINTIDLLGDDVVIDSIIERTITEYRDNVITSIGSHAFAGCKLLDTIELPNVETIGVNAFYQGCNTAISLPRITTLTGQGFSYSYIREVRLSNVETIQRYGLYYMGDLTALILDNPEKVCVLEHAKGIYATQIDGVGSAEAQKNKGYIYVPRALIEDYKVATNWSTLAHKFRAIEDYTVDGTITGELDESKI